MTALNRWRQDIADHQAMSSDPLLPPGWESFWVRLDSVAQPPHPVDARQEILLLSASDPAELIAESGLRSLPAHLVLNREGLLVSAGPGAPLPLSEAFRDDCTMGYSERDAVRTDGQ